MARVSQTQGATNPSGEFDAEPTRGSPAAVVAALASEALELDRPESVRADHSRLSISAHGGEHTESTVPASANGQGAFY